MSKTKAYLNASSIKVRSQFMDQEFHGFFISKDSNRKNKTESLRSFGNWDCPMKPDVKVLSASLSRRQLLLTFNEQNNFSKLIGYPGWRGSMYITFARKKLIIETIYLPDSTNLSYQPFLQPAINWLMKNRPQGLDSVYRNNQLVKSTTTAYKWQELLTAWKNSSR